MENRKDMIDKELKLEYKNVQKEIERLTKEKEKYGFDFNASKKVSKNIKYITLSNVALACLANMINPFIGTLSYPIFSGFMSHFEEKLIEKYNISKDTMLGVFSSKEEITSNYLKILNIEYEIEKYNLKSKIIENTIDINKEDYRAINNNEFEDNDKRINIIALRNLYFNDNLLEDVEKYSSDIFLKSTLFDLLGGGVVFLNSSFSSLLVLGGMCLLSSVSLIPNSKVLLNNGMNPIDDLCENVRNDFLKEKTNENISIYEEQDYMSLKFISEYGTFFDKLYIDDLSLAILDSKVSNSTLYKKDVNTLISDIIDEESYKMLNDYNINIESIIRKRKIEEYYKKKQEIIKYLDDCKNNENKKSRKKMKVKSI